GTGAYAGPRYGFKPTVMPKQVVNRPGMSGDSSSWKGWGHVRW
ncbi:hypothetical protein, partial [Mycobacterium tuberculosis]